MEEDAVYVEQCQRGDAAAFGVLYDRYLDKIYRFVYYKTYNKEVAEDLVSDVFMRALEKVNTFDMKRGSFSSWLYQIARNRVIDHYRTNRPTEDIDDMFDLGVDDRTPETLDAIDSLGAVTEYLQTLSAKQREIIILRVWEEKSYKEIAEIVGGTEDSVKMAFSRSIRALRETCGPVALATIAVACAQLSALPFTPVSY